MYIYLQPFGEINRQFLEDLGKTLQEVYGFPYRIVPALELPINAYSRKRRQWHATTILKRALNINIPQDAEKVLGVTEVDLFEENLNFVFGVADPYHGTTIISLCRLKPEYYMLPPNEKLFQQRAVKEAIHELGHTYGLEHCSNPGCIMYFSNTLSDTDRKGPGFCKACSKKLKHMLK